MLFNAQNGRREWYDRKAGAVAEPKAILSRQEKAVGAGSSASNLQTERQIRGIWQRRRKKDSERISLSRKKRSQRFTKLHAVAAAIGHPGYRAE